MQGWAEKPHVKNGPALGGYGAVAMNAALTASMTKLPQQLRKTLTWDRGNELSGHALFALETGTKVFFADPHSPWQRPTNENTNGLLRQYLPKGTDLSRWSAEDLDAVAHALNNRPRKILGWRTPAEVFEEQLRSFNNPVLQRPLELAQFRSRKYLRALSRHDLLEAMGQVGSSADNAAMESWFALLQKNVLDRRTWDTRDQLRLAIVTWTERTYHRRRRQARLGKLTPIEYETIMTTPATQAA